MLFAHVYERENAMTNDLEGFAGWQDNIDARVSKLEVTVAAEARARAQMDRDMTVQFRFHGKLLQALAQTQSEHTATLARHSAMLDDHTARLIRLEAGQERLEAGMSTVVAGVQTIIELLDPENGGNTRD